MIALYIILGLIAFIVILLHISVTVDVVADSKEGIKYSVKYLFFTLYPRKPKTGKTKKRKKKKQQEEDSKQEIVPLDEKELAAELERLDKEEIDGFDDSFEDDLPEIVDSIEPVNMADNKKSAKADKKLQKALKKDEKKAKKAAKKEARDNKKKQPKSKKKSGLLDKFNYYKPLLPMGWKYFKKLLKAIRISDTDILLVTAKPDAYESALFYGKLQLALNNALALICGIFTVRLKSVGVRCEFNDDKLDYHAACKVRLRPSTVIAIAVCVLINYLLFRHRKKKEADKAKDIVSNEKTEEKLSA